MTVTPEVDVEVTDPLVAEIPDCELLPLPALLEALVLLDDLLDEVEAVRPDDAVKVEDLLAAAVPGMV